MDSGLKVSLIDGWEDRGRGDMDLILGVLCHHTATNATGNMPTLDTLLKGRSDLQGPLSQLGLGRDGTFYILAAGRCNHAGHGIWNNVVNGNSNFIGIEAENTGGSKDYPWPDVQMVAYRRGVAAILQHLNQDISFCAGHKEYALPRGRKNDPSFDMIDFRSAVKEIMDGTAGALALIPSKELVPPYGTSPRPTLRRNSGIVQDLLVKKVQSKLNIEIDGLFGAKTEAALRNFQSGHGLVPDGIVGPKTWLALDGV
ncbi:MAG: peptidoglycan-binding domain-containing protein [Flavisolibacter sp.]